MPILSVAVGSLAELVVTVIAHVEPYKGRGWDEKKIFDRVPQLARVAVTLARAIVAPACPEHPG